MTVISALDKYEGGTIVCLSFKVCLHDFLPQILYGLQAALLAPYQIRKCVIRENKKGMTKSL